MNTARTRHVCLHRGLLGVSLKARLGLLPSGLASAVTALGENLYVIEMRFGEGSDTKSLDFFRSGPQAHGFSRRTRHHWVKNGLDWQQTSVCETASEQGRTFE